MRVEQTLQSYEDKDEAKRPALAFPFWPEIPEPGEEVTAPPMPKRPPRKPAGPNYCLGSQPEGWVQRSIAQSALPAGTRRKPTKPLPERPAWVTSPSGKWKQTLTPKDRN